MSDTEGAPDAGVVQVQPDGGTAPLAPEANAEGVKPVNGVDSKYQSDVEAESALDKRLSDIYDKLNPEGTAQVEEPAEAVEKVGEVGKVLRDLATGQFKSSKTDQPQTAPAGQPSAATQLPRSWSPEKAELWNALPPEARELIAARESEAHTTISRQGQTLAAFRPLGELLLANREVFDKHRVDPVSGVARLIAVQQRLDSDPMGTIAAIAQQYGVDLGKLGAPAQPKDGQPKAPVSQTEAQLRAELARLNARLDHREVNEKRQALAHEQALQAETDQDVRQWATDKPYFQHVRGLMATLVETKQASTLDEAYDMATYANPSIRSQLTKQQLAAAEQREKAAADAKRKETEKHTSAAMRAAKIQVGGDGRRVAPAAHNGKWDEDGYLGGVFDRVATSGR
jgi:hypothetical protein